MAAERRQVRAFMHRHLQGNERRLAVSARRSPPADLAAALFPPPGH